MVSSISSMNSAVSMMRSNSMQRQPPPPPADKDVFKLSDTDSNGVVSGTELDTLVKGIEEVTGKTIDPDTLAGFDTDQDGGLNGKELLSLMQKNGFSVPEIINSESEGTGIRPPPPPPPTEQALSAYAKNTGDDMLSQLMDLLQSGASENNGTTSVDVTS
ncbi:EF-hand domain-containing protein [Desulfopila aestuarii]|uniref:EF-hand domain-containing protein n=1 Tax=Desulfopila aestuarii DSM 18488 TaxID=1121416 RepID=A0A1M7YBN0_9BACT|nr:EF-hand domain-containing protein [Desulfopila aestuarii]SHO49928.1 hypothetical protein SAMN02745220_03166 [Desulfopila aestuarii DSM 18488]